MKKSLVLTLSLLAFLSACNTIQGAGQDIKDAGQGISSAAEKTKDTLEGK